MERPGYGLDKVFAVFLPNTDSNNMLGHSVFKRLVAISVIGQLHVGDSQGKISTKPGPFADVQNIIKVLCAAKVVEEDAEDGPIATAFTDMTFYKD